MYVLYVILMYGASILSWVSTCHILFIANLRRSDVESTGSWQLDFWHVSFGMSVRKLDVQPLGSWRFYFGPPG